MQLRLTLGYRLATSIQSFTRSATSSRENSAVSKSMKTQMGTRAGMSAPDMCKSTQTAPVSGCRGAERATHRRSLDSSRDSSVTMGRGPDGVSEWHSRRTKQPTSSSQKRGESILSASDSGVSVIFGVQTGVLYTYFQAKTFNFFLDRPKEPVFF